MKEREESVVDFALDDFEGEEGYAVVVEFEGGHLLLEAPGVAIDVEDSFAEEVAEDGREGFPLGKVVEPGLENVLDVFHVGRDGVAEHVDVDGFGRGGSEEVGVPVAEVVEVLGPA